MHEFLYKEYARLICENGIADGEHMFQSIVRTLPDIVYRLDAQGRIVYINDAVSRYGFRPFDLIGTSIFDYVHPEDREKARFRVNERRSGDRRTRSFEIRLLHKDRSVADFEVRTSVTRASEAPVFLVDAEGLYHFHDADDRTFLGSQGIARDITERKKAEQALEASEHKFQVLFDSMEDGVCLYEMMFDDEGQARDYRVLDANPRFEMMLGKPRNETVGKRATELFETIEPPHLAKYAAVVREGETIRFETWDPRLNRHFRISAFLAEENRFATTMEDITDRTTMEARLVESEQRYRQLVMNMKDMVALHEPDGAYLYVSPSVKDLLGYEPGEMIGRDPYEMIHPDDRERIKHECHDRVMSNHDIDWVEYRIRTKWGRHIWFETSAKPIVDETGDIVKLQTISKEITERKQAEEALRISEERFRLLAENMPILINAITKDGAFSFWNRACERATGYSRDEVVGKPDLVNVLYTDPVCWIDLFDECADDGAGRKETEIGLISKDGTEKTIVWSAIPPGLAPSTMESWAVGIDITDRKRAEEALKSSLRQRDALLKEVHHRVKNNLEIISSLLFLQSNSVGDPVYEGLLNESIHRIHSMALIHEKLYKSDDFERIRLDQYIEQLKNVLLSFYDSEADHIQTSVTVSDISVGLDQAIPLGLIVNELFTNCIKHAFPGGRDGSVSIGIEEDHGAIVLTYRDDGVGFDHESARASSSSLGLKIVDLLSKQLHGRLDVESGPGETKFRLSIPTRA